MPKIRSIVPSDNNGAIRIRFTYNGKPYKFNIKGLKWEEEKDRVEANRIASVIESDCEHDNLDEYLIKYGHQPTFSATEVRVAFQKGFYRLIFKHKSKSYNINAGQSLDKAERLAHQINEECKSGIFNPDSYTKPSEASIQENRRIEQARIDKENPYLLPLWDEWVSTLGLPARTKEKHYDAIRRMAEKAGKPRLSELTWLTEAGLKHTTFNQRRSYLVKFEGWLLEEKGIDAKFRLKSRKAEEFEEEANPFTREEMKAIVNAFRNNSFCPNKSAFKRSHYADYVEFCILTASRPQEAIGLRWKDVDFTHDRLIISTVLARQDRGARKRKELKAGNIKVLPLKGRLLEILKTKKPDDATDEDLVFPSTNGKAIDDTNFRDRHWIPVLNGLKIEYRRFYNIRHSVLTAVVKETGNLMEAAKLAGHKNLRMVQERYGHLVGDTKAFEL